MTSHTTGFRRPSTIVRGALALWLSAVAAASAGPLPQPVASTAQWIRGGELLELPMMSVGSRPYLSVEHLAQMAQAQLRWQPVAKQACLSNANAVMCFDWDENAVYRNDRKIHGSVPLRFEDDRLLVPITFVESKDFQNFCSSDLRWNKEKNELVQNPHVNLQIPPVERTDGVYRLSLAVDPRTPPQLIEQSDKEVWVRFSRAQTEGSQILQGDTVIKEVRINQKRHSADLIVELGEDARGAEVYFTEDRKTLNIDVDTSGAAPAPALSAAPEPAVLRSHEAHPAPKRGKTEIKVQAPKSSVSAAAAPAGAAVFLSAHPGPAVVPAPAVKPRAQREAAAPVERTPGRTVVVVDAGHGGNDCGAIGVRGTMEKDVNLEVARALVKELLKSKGIRVIMTRSRDEFIPLSQRTSIANSAGATLFVSVHCNSSLSSKSSGFEVYFLSPDASDKAAEGLARVENSVVSLEAHKGASANRLEELLASMAVYNFLNESSKFASFVSKKVHERSSATYSSVKEANFYVLRGAQMPSVLLELDYLSNPVTEMKLRSSRFRAQLVKGVVDGILAYDHYRRQEREAYAPTPRTGRRTQ